MRETGFVFYVISDIHGEADRYQKMLDTVSFSDSDTLYILGDVLDPGGVALMQRIATQSNVHILLGNHKLMCLEALHYGGGQEKLDRWINEGGEKAYEEFMTLFPVVLRDRLLNYMVSLPAAVDIEVGCWPFKKKFHLVHGFPGKSVAEMVWGRPSANTANPLPRKQKLIIGHTPTPFLQSAQAKFLMGLAGSDEHITIAHCKGFIDVDCGLACGASSRRLGCLRLEDMKYQAGIPLDARLFCRYS